MVNQIDLIDSFAELFNIELSAGDAVDSRSTLNAFLGNDPVGQEYMLEESFGLALRHGEWKYTRPVQPKWPQGRPPIEKALYNLADDPGETTNIIADHPERVEEMVKKLAEMENSVGLRK